MLLKNEVTSVDLVNVFGERSYTFGRKLNIVNEEYYDEALIIAQKKIMRDRKLKIEGELMN